MGEEIIEINQNQPAPQESSNKFKIFLIIFIFLIVIVVISFILIFGKSIFKNNDSANVTQSDLGVNEPIKQSKIMGLTEFTEDNKDFGILKYQTKFDSGNTPLLDSPYLPSGFNNDIKECYGITYSRNENGDEVRIILQSYESKKSYEILKNYITQEMEKYYSVEVDELDYNNREFICTVKSTEGVRCYWTSDDKIIFMLLEESQETINNNPSLGESWNQLREYYLDSFPPSN